MASDGATGQPLSSYLQAIGAVVKAHCATPKWVIAEVSECNRKAAHLYVTLAEFGQRGNAVATVKANAFGVEGGAWWKRFTDLVAGPPQVGMRLLLQVTAEFRPSFGFSLNICDLDASFVLGELAAKLKRLLARLGDFMRDGEILQRLGLLEIKTIPAGLLLLRGVGQRVEGRLLHEMTVMRAMRKFHQPGWGLPRSPQPKCREACFAAGAAGAAEGRSHTETQAGTVKPRASQQEK